MVTDLLMRQFNKNDDKNVHMKLLGIGYKDAFSHMDKENRIKQVKKQH